MGKEISFKKRLKSGESVTGRVEDVSDSIVTFEMKDETLLELGGVPDTVREKLDDDFSGEIVTLKCKEDGEYSIKELDEFPDDEKKK